MKKIVFYIGSILRPGGAERVMTNLVNYFFERGYDVLLITDVSNEKKDAEYPINKAVKRVTVDVNYKNTILKNLFRIRKLRKYIKDYEPTLVVSFMGPPNIRMILSTIGLSCKKVVSVRNDPYSEYGRGIKRLGINWLFSFAEGHVFQTDRVGLYFDKRINKRSKIIVNPVNSSFFTTQWCGEEKTIISVGRLETQKNHSLLIKAFSQISDSILDYRLVLYGDGSQKDYLKQISKVLGIENKVIFAGEVINVEDVLARASLFVLSSDFEGMPNALMEAMAVGIPCIATDCPVGGSAMLFSEELSQYLFPCGDNKALAALMLKVLKLSQDERREIGVKMGKRAESFQPQKIYSEWEKYFNSICLN